MVGKYNDSSWAERPVCRYMCVKTCIDMVLASYVQYLLEVLRKPKTTTKIRPKPRVSGSPPERERERGAEVVR